MTNLFNFKETRDSLEEKYSNPNTLKAKVVEIINWLKIQPFTTEKLLREYRDYLIELKEEADELLDTRELEGGSLEELRSTWENYRTCYEKFLVGLYLFIPALRSDYCNAQLIGDTIHIENLVKQNTNKSMDIQLPTKLYHMRQYFMDIPQNHKVLSSHIIKASMKIFGEPLGINNYRRLWVDYQKRIDNDLDSRITLAKKMNHSLMTSKYIYERHC